MNSPKNNSEYFIEHKGIKYRIKPQYIYSTDEVDKRIREYGVEQTLIPEYLLIDKYVLGEKKPISINLDFTFASPTDVIRVELEESITSITIDCKNLRGAKFKGKTRIDFNIEFDEQNMLDKIWAFKRFIEENKELVRCIYIHGISDNKLMQEFIKKICSANNIQSLYFVTPKKDESGKKLNKTTKK